MRHITVTSKELGIRIMITGLARVGKMSKLFWDKRLPGGYRELD